MGISWPLASNKDRVTDLERLVFDGERDVPWEASGCIIDYVEYEVMQVERGEDRDELAVRWRCDCWIRSEWWLVAGFGHCQVAEWFSARALEGSMSPWT